MKKVLVFAASGLVGSALVKQLVASGVPVRAATSRADAAGTREGVEWVHADLATGSGLAAAFAGVRRAFLIAPPGHADQYRVLSPAVEEAKRAGLEKVVLMTAMGANAVETTPFRRVERELEQSGLAWNIIRPNWFMQNFQTFWLHGILNQGKILLPAGTAKTSFIDARDISAVAFRLLTTDDQDNRDFDLTGPAAIDHAEVARIITRVSGRAVAYEEITPDTLRQGLLGAGLPADYTEFLLVILDFLKQGYAERTTDAVRNLTGREPIAFARYAQDNVEAWRA